MMSQLHIGERETFLAPSAEFRKEARKSVIAIVGFITVYLLLFVLVLALVAFCCFIGITIIAAKPSFLTLVAGIGIMGCAVMVLVFMVKFIFSSTKADDSDSIEISREEQPRLFEVIYLLAEETGTPKPAKIFLSPDVNAAVFYNSSFWSMFLPVKKNLKIGFGLVNAVSVSELKAVIAHEFGHFSQRSMKVGSWVYQVNKIIYDMLYNNTGYARSLDSFSNVHGLVALFVRLTVYVIQAIQWVLNKMFSVVNRSYMSLSRQMEFHADLVAASVCGSNNIINALKRSEFADSCFAATMDVCNNAWQDKKVVDNFFEHYHTVIKHASRINQLNLVNGLPVIKEEEESPVTRRVNYKDQWASHPTLQERKAYLDGFDLTAAEDNTPALSLFQNAEEWNKRLTKVVYRNIPNEEVKGTLDGQQFEEKFTGNLQAFSHPAVFKEYYDSRFVTSFDPEIVVQTAVILQPFEEVLTEERILLPKKLSYLHQDIAALEGIVKKEVITNSFDFDGRKYVRKEAATVLAQLETEREAIQKELDALDKTLFRYFYAIAPLAEAERLKSEYRNYFDRRSKSDAFLDKANSMMAHLGPVFRGESMEPQAILAMIGELKEKHEAVFKTELKEWLVIGAFDADSTVKAAVEKFISTQYQYFSGNSFFDNELIELSNLAEDSWKCVNHYVFSLFRNITETQALFLQRKKEGVPEA